MGKLEGNADCPPELDLAIGRFNSRLTKSHTKSAKAKKFSIWHLMSEEIEPIILEILGQQCFDRIAPQGLFKSAINDLRGLENRCRQQARLYSELGVLTQEDWGIYGTLEFLVTLIQFCNNRMPHTRTGNEGRIKLRKRLEHFPFCELCHRLCESEKIRVSSFNKERDERNKISMRFCERHRPGTNEYRRDLNYRDAFHEKIGVLSGALRNHSYTDGIDELKEIADERCLNGQDIIYSLMSYYVPAGSSDQILDEHLPRPKNFPPSYFNIDKNIRYVAYLLVHKDSTKHTRKSPIPRDRNTVVRLKAAIAEGKSIPTAAKEIGISRQAAWKALKKVGAI
ncbi:MAG: hypothetical protein WCT35_09655 [Sideroxydans sp.]|jgi:hypothetical protein